MNAKIEINFHIGNTLFKNDSPIKDMQEAKALMRRAYKFKNLDGYIAKTNENGSFVVISYYNGKIVRTSYFKGLGLRRKYLSVSRDGEKTYTSIIK